MGVTIQQVLRRGFEGYARERKMPGYQAEAARALMSCRTAALGAHVARCPSGHYERLQYNSCRHRSCPQCCHARTERWLERRRMQMLQCDHFHAIFTIPSELDALWRFNRRHMADLLFRAAGETLLELLADPKYLGATPGIIASLHTWGQTLQLHPHVHCLVTGGGYVHRDESWREVRNGFLLPMRVAMAVFRGKLLDFVRRSLRCGKLLVPPRDCPASVRTLTFALGRKKWNVHIRSRYPHGQGVLTYLGRYVRGGPIRNRRVLRADADTVSFSYADNRDPDAAGRSKRKEMTLSSHEFQRRLLDHVPQPRVHVVRHFGLFANSGYAARARCREILGTPSADTSSAADPGPATSRCPVCRLTLVHLFSRGPVTTPNLTPSNGKPQIPIRGHALPSLREVQLPRCS